MSECKYCKKESYERPFCPDCGKKYFGFSEVIKPAQKEINPQKIEKKEKSKENKYLFEDNFNFEDDFTFEDDFSLRQDHEEDVLYKELPNYLSNDIRNDFINEQSNKFCLNCGKESNNHRFCDECYYKLMFCHNAYYKKYSPQKNINNPKQKQYISAKTGTITKSKSECMICDYLSDHHIIFFYEKPLYYSDYAKPLKPDFYIKGPFLFKGKIIYDVYIEHLGGLSWKDQRKKQEYINQLDYKIEIYKRLGITLICTYEEDMEDINTKLTKKLLTYKRGIINI